MLVSAFVEKPLSLLVAPGGAVWRLIYCMLWCNWSIDGRGWRLVWKYNQTRRTVKNGHSQNPEREATFLATVPSWAMSLTGGAEYSLSLRLALQMEVRSSPTRNLDHMNKACLPLNRVKNRPPASGEMQPKTLNGAGSIWRWAAFPGPVS